MTVQCLPSDGPVLAEGLPQLDLLGREAVEQQLLGVAVHEGHHGLLRQVLAAVHRVAARLEDQAQRREQEVNQLRRVRVVDVRLQLSLGEGGKVLVNDALDTFYFTVIWRQTYG